MSPKVQRSKFRVPQREVGYGSVTSARHLPKVPSEDSSAVAIHPVRPELTRRPALTVKRLVDVIGAAAGLVVMSPVALLCALMVRLTSRGPVFFVQCRVAKDGSTFRMIKFRTMRVGTHEEVIATRASHDVYIANDFKLPHDDPRITAVGRILRKTSLDEIPQLVNVLRGDMSLVGIRPVERAQLELRPPLDQAYYRAMRPGLTGLWQIDGRSSVVPHERLALDRAYVDGWSLWADIKILARTPIAVLHLSRTS